MTGPLRVLASLVLFFGFANGAFAQTAASSNSEDKDKKTIIGVGVEAKFLGVNGALGNSKTEVSNVPLELRQVISHPDDTWIYGSKQVIRTIPYDSLELGAVGGLTFVLSPELTVWRFRVRSGMNFYIGGPAGTPDKSNEGSTREINQYGKPERGYGTSLVYYSIYGQNSWKPGLSNEADLDIGKDFLIIVGYGWNNYKISAEKGYDRWDALEKYKTYDIGTGRIVKKYVGFGWQPEAEEGWRPITISLVFGKMNTEVNLADAAQGMTFDSGRPWFFEFSFNAHGVFKLK